MKYLSRHTDLSIFFKADGTFASIFIIKDDSDAGFCYTGLTAFVYQVLQILSSDSAHIRYAEDETYCVENI